jgi:hypothetical protein
MKNIKQLVPQANSNIFAIKQQFIAQCSQLMLDKISSAMLKIGFG